MENARQKGLFLFTLLAVLFISIGLAITFGSADISFVDSFRIMASNIFFLDSVVEVDWQASHESIIMQLRLPRIILGVLIGASLSVAGVTFQGILKNPLADPYTIGVSSGAAVGASLAMFIQNTYGISFSHIGGIPLFAFVGGCLTLFLVYNLARIGGSVPVVTLLLAGVVVSSFLSAIISLLMIVAGEDMQEIFFWISGGLTLRGWNHVLIILPYLILALIVIFYYSKEMNILLLGEETATYLGVEVERLKKILLVTASLLTAIAVSVSGMIGFVGLVIPHAVRMILGPDHRFLLPGSVLLGAIFLIWADTFARTILSPGEIPVGIVTAFVGAPFFLFLLKRKRRDFTF